MYFLQKCKASLLWTLVLAETFCSVGSIRRLLRVSTVYFLWLELLRLVCPYFKCGAIIYCSAVVSLCMCVSVCVCVGVHTHVYIHLYA